MNSGNNDSGTEWLLAIGHLVKSTCTLHFGVLLFFLSFFSLLHSHLLPTCARISLWIAIYPTWLSFVTVIPVSLLLPSIRLKAADHFVNSCITLSIHTSSPTYHCLIFVIIDNHTPIDTWCCRPFYTQISLFLYHITIFDCLHCQDPTFMWVSLSYFVSRYMYWLL